jgi:hypothetical protein
MVRSFFVKRKCYVARSDVVNQPTVTRSRRGLIRMVIGIVRPKAFAYNPQPNDWCSNRPGEFRKD